LKWICCDLIQFVSLEILLVVILLVLFYATNWIINGQVTNLYLCALSKLLKMLELLRITEVLSTIFVLKVWLKSCRCATAIKAKVLLSELLAHIVLLKG
jgi:hypothetical protein